MNEYGDEAFIYELARREASPKYIGNDIRNGSAYVGDDYVRFREQCIIENKFYMIIPDEFEPLVQWMIKKSYHYENRPDIVFADEKVTKSVNIWLKDNPHENAEPEAVLEHMLTKINPNHEVIGTIAANAVSYLEIESEGIKIGHIELVTANDDKEMSDILFFFPLDGKFVIGSFKCKSADTSKWADITKQMLCSMRIVSNYEDKGD